MIDIMFRKLAEKVLIRVTGKKLSFAKVQGQGLYWSSIEGLKFSVDGILKEYPDLKEKTNKEVLEIGKQRFKDYIKN